MRANQDDGASKRTRGRRRVFVIALRGPRRISRPYSRGFEDRPESSGWSEPLRGRFPARAGRPSDSSRRCRPPSARRARSRRPPSAGPQGPRGARRKNRPILSIPARARALLDANRRVVGRGSTPPQVMARWKPGWTVPGHLDSVGPRRWIWFGRCSRPGQFRLPAGHRLHRLECYRCEATRWSPWAGRCFLWTWRRAPGTRSRSFWTDRSSPRASACRRRAETPISCPLGRRPRMTRYSGGRREESQRAMAESRRPRTLR
jgi:hypothetical protein